VDHGLWVREQPRSQFAGVVGMAGVEAEVRVGAEMRVQVRTGLIWPELQKSTVRPPPARRISEFHEEARW
jgi:hypothetical protein